MKRKHSILIIFVMTLLFMMGFSIQSAASSTGVLHVQIAEQTKVLLYKVADYDGKTYTPAEKLKDSGASMEVLVEHPSDDNAKAVYDYLHPSYQADYVKKSSGGVARFDRLEQGIWLVCTEPDQEIEFKPFFVFIPKDSDGADAYVVDATPKVESGNKDTIHVMVKKKWDDDSDAAGDRPDSVTVKLLLDGNVVKRIQLSEQNGWHHTFKNLKNEEGYSVEEIAVDGYTAKYSGDAKNGFIITNVYDTDENGGKLPQTGQKWLPIIILLIAGVSCISLGIIEVRERRNEEDA